MKSHKGLINNLKSILKLLEKERQALINNDPDQISEIVNKKNMQMEELSAYKGMDIQKIKDVMDLIKEINSIQELNLLLTNQALSYQNAILESISNNLNNFSNTYSSKGRYERANNINIIDQSV